jgi:hypothetical protein
MFYQVRMIYYLFDNIFYSMTTEIYRYDPDPNPEFIGLPDPDPQFRIGDPRIRILEKYTRIRTLQLL